MQEKSLYEYAVIRILPKVEREEFMNVGLILFSKEKNYIRMDYFFSDEKLRCFATELDIELVYSSLKSFELIANGDKDGGPIAELPIPERFRWLTAEKSACIQTSRPHAGFSDNLELSFQKLFAELVR